MTAVKIFDRSDHVAFAEDASGRAENSRGAPRRGLFNLARAPQFRQGRTLGRELLHRHGIHGERLAVVSLVVKPSGGRLGFLGSYQRG